MVHQLSGGSHCALKQFVTSTEAVDLGLTLFERYPALGAFDAVLAAVALNQRTEALVSADRAFGHVPNLQWVDPATTSLDLLIGD
jgi:predicted nucleic acid-binding protein